MILRPYRKEDCGQTARLFYETVHRVNARDYTGPQLNAWAPEVPDLRAWDASFLAHRTLVAWEGGEILGFGDLDLEGRYLDRLYVRWDAQGRGIAAALCDALEAHCRELGVDAVTVHASKTARPFFEARGYRVVRPQQVERRGVKLTNFRMEKGCAGRAEPGPGR